MLSELARVQRTPSLRRNACLSGSVKVALSIVGIMVGLTIATNVSAMGFASNSPSLQHAFRVAPITGAPARVVDAGAPRKHAAAAETPHVLERTSPSPMVLGRGMNPGTATTWRAGLLNVGSSSKGGEVSNAAAHINFGNPRFFGGIEDHLGLSVIVENILGSKVDLEDELVPGRALPASWAKWVTSAKFVEWAHTPRPGWSFNRRSHARCPSNGYENPLHKYKKGPMMFIPEIVLMVRQLKSGYNVVEYGAGMSTISYAFCVGETGSWTSVEGNLEWCTELRGLLPPNVRAHCAVMPQNPRLGNPPYTARDIITMTPYANALDGMCYDKKIDVVLNDGDVRNRIAREILPYLHNKSVMIIHDAWIKGQVESNQIENMILISYDLVAVAGPGLSVFRPKPEALVKAKALAKANKFAWGCAERNAQLWECATPISAGGTAACIASTTASYPPTTTSPASCAELCTADLTCAAFQIEYGGAGLCTLISKAGFVPVMVAGTRGSHAELRGVGA